MGPERWRQVEEIFQRALEQPSERREAFLVSLCAGDDELYREARSMLAADARSAGFLDEPGAATEAVEGSDQPVAGRIGPYRLLRELGAGGTSRVYLAVRDDGQYLRRVAIKSIRRDHVHPDLRRRFLVERQILASLQHPNVAEFYDGDVTADGTPYVVMEYVDGLPIDRHCEQRSLAIEQRISLFRTVCSAVHHAHQHLVVHRDLKPGNILVTANGEPKLLDFGIAKLLRDSGLPMDDTAPGLQPLTPQYASPEQVRGERVTTASDVYSLGALLFRLLTGRLPYTFDSGQTAEIERVVCEQQPRKPSAVVNRESRLRARLAGDLDNVVLKALHKDPRRRYTSAEQLAEDLERYLEGLPVRARETTFIYRAGKFLRRHRFATTAVVGFFSLILGFAALTARQAQRIALERDAAREVAELLVEIFKISDSDRASSKYLTAGEVLKQCTKRLSREYKGQSVLKAKVMATLGEVYMGLYLFSDAEELFEASVAVLADSPETHPLDLAASRLSLARLKRFHGELDVAENLLVEALDDTSSWYSGRDDPLAAEAMRVQAAVFDDKTEYDAAERLLRKALDLQRRVGNDEAYAETLRDLVKVHLHRGEYDAAMATFQRITEIPRKVFVRAHPRIEEGSRDRSGLEFHHDYYKELLLFSRQVRDLMTLINGTEHSEFTTTLVAHGLAVCESRLGNLEASKPPKLQVLVMRCELLGGRYPVVVWVLNDLRTLRIVADDLGAEGDLLSPNAGAIRLRRRLTN